MSVLFNQTLQRKNSAQIYIYIICIYNIYIYIVIHRQTVLLYLNSSVWLDMRNAYKLGLKPSWPYANLITYLPDINSFSLSKEILTQCISINFPLFTFMQMTGVLSSLDELCVKPVVTVNSFAKVFKLQRGAYILSSTDRLFHCVTTPQCG